MAGLGRTWAIFMISASVACPFFELHCGFITKSPRVSLQAPPIFFSDVLKIEKSVNISIYIGPRFPEIPQVKRIRYAIHAVRDGFECFCHVAITLFSYPRPSFLVVK